MVHGKTSRETKLEATLERLIFGNRLLIVVVFVYWTTGLIPAAIAADSDCLLPDAASLAAAQDGAPAP